MMIMFNDTNVGCYDFHTANYAWTASDERQNKNGLFARLTHRSSERSAEARRTTVAAARRPVVAAH